MKKIVSVSMLLLLVFALFMGTVASAAEGPTVEVSSATKVAAGSEVTLTVSLANNPGVAGITLTPVYDTNVFDFVSYGKVDGFSTGWTLVTNAVWDNSEDVTYNGNILTITLKVKDGVTPGDYSVGVKITASNQDIELVNFTATAGTVNVICEHTTTTVQGKKDATCTEAGYTGDTVCTNCNTVITQGTVIEALGHDIKVTGKKDATCKEAGYTGDEVCTRCDYSVAGNVINALEHEIEVKNAKDATCGEDGYTGDKVCKLCNETIEKGQTIAATGKHTLTDVAEVPATCTATGTKAHSVCSVCGTLFSDKGGPTDKDSLVIEKIAHVTEEVALKAATVSESGVKAHYICTVCQNLFKDAAATEPTTLEALSFSVDAKLDIQPMNKTTLGDYGLDSLEALESKMRTKVDSSYPESNISVQDYTVLIDHGDGRGHVEPTADELAAGIDIYLDVPDAVKADAGKYVYTVTHLKQDGTVEVLAKDVNSVDGFISVTVTSLSPIAISWKEAPVADNGNGNGNGTADNGANNGNGNKSAAPKTGDASNIALWVVMMSVCAAGVVVISTKKKTSK